MPPPLIFLITGSSSGLGLSLSLAALYSSHKVIATMRDPSKAPESLISHPNCAVIQLDVTAPNLESIILEACLPAFGGNIDILINNAGYAYGGPLEDISLSEAHNLFETAFWSPLRLMRTLTPHFRQRRTGTIINIGSGEDLLGRPGVSIYAAAKHALEGATESLKAELEPVGIRVWSVGVGGMRTSFLSSSSSDTGGSGNLKIAPLSEAYRDTPADLVIRAVRETNGRQMLDPERVAKRIVEAVEGAPPVEEGWPEGGVERYGKLVFGKEYLEGMEEKAEALRKNSEAMEVVARSCDFDE